MPTGSRSSRDQSDDQPPKPTPTVRERQRRPLERALALLDVLVDAFEPVGVAEAARRAGLPKSSAMRLLTDLRNAGMVDRTPDGYVPGDRVLSLGERAHPADLPPLRRLLLPHVVTLHDETGLSAAFATFRYGRVRFETVVYATSMTAMLDPIPLWCPTHCTSSGKILLAYGLAPTPPPAMVSYTDRTIVDPAALAEELARIRHDGLAANDGEYVAGVDALAVPIFGARMRPVGTLALCGSAGAINQRQARAALRRAARAVAPAVRALTASA